MKAKSLTAAALAALVLTSGCAKKPPKELPKPPGTETGIGTGQNGGSATPGSRADFLDSVPSDRIFFDTDTYNVDDQDRQILDAQAAWLQRYPNVRVTIEGHAD